MNKFTHLSYFIFSLLLLSCTTKTTQTSDKEIHVIDFKKEYMAIMIKKTFTLGLVLLFTHILFVSCSQDEYMDTKINTRKESTIRIISESELPKGVQPLVLKNKAELYDLIEKLDRVKLTSASPLKKDLYALKQDQRDQELQLFRLS